ncbi:MAG: molybdopterin-dependent oxidoreductase [Dehalococcoidia bacterium]|nr:MAG: molybdopterin-dependent oxidoreductase [Dehalococcoidia bacterium]
MISNQSDEMAIMTTCSSHCGGCCGLKVYVKDGVITRIETDDGEEPQARACLKGRAYRQRVYHPDRLLYPLKRVGERGDGKFEQISWDEALDTVANQIMRVRDTYGPQAILLKTSVGDMNFLHTGAMVVEKLLAMAGGYSATWGYQSYEAGSFAELCTYGTMSSQNSREDFLNSRMIILWGWDPAITIQDTNTTWWLAQAREAGCRIVSIDPRFTDTTVTVAHQWIPIKPGTDAAMMVAMAYVMLRDGLQDQAFLDKYTHGFDRFRDYVMGTEDGIPKTPAWAESITGVPAPVIETLAREYATSKPAALIAGIGPGRSARGEQYHRAAITLAAITGNIGIHGGSASQRSWPAGLVPFPFLMMGIPDIIVNPLEANAPPPEDMLPIRRIWPYGAGSIHVSKIADALLKGRSGGYPADYKLLYIASAGYPNQFLNVNKHVQALKSESLEFVVMHEQVMTPGAKFADILLPCSTFLERNDIAQWSATWFYGYQNKVIEPLGESKSSLDICKELAKRLDIAHFFDKTEDETLRDMVDMCPDINDYEAFRKQGLRKMNPAEPHVAFREQIEDPENNPFPTPSGKIEIYSQLIAEMNDPEIPPIPKYLDSWESSTDPLSEKYPLQLITTHFKGRAHSQFHNVPWLRELLPQTVLISSSDARARGIKDGDSVRVFNDRGQMIIPARVSGRIMSGVVDVPQGAWFDLDQEGIDRGGCANILTRDEYSPGGGYCTNTALVQVEPV